MNAVHEIIHTMSESLDNVEVPQGVLSSEAVSKFEAQLRPIFFDAVFATDKTSLDKFKKQGPVGFHPDKLIGIQAQVRPFTQKLRTASSITQGIPIRLFNEYATMVDDYELSRESWRVVLTKLPTFGANNIQIYADDASQEEKERIDAYNKKVVQYLLYCLNSVFINITTDIMYQYYRYPSFIAGALYYGNALINSLLVAAVVLPIIAILIMKGMIFLLRTYVEEPFLFLLTANYYYKYIEQEACNRVAEELAKEPRVVVTEASEDGFETSPGDWADVYLVNEIERRIQQNQVSNCARSLPSLSADDIVQIKRHVYAENAGNFGAQHLRYVIESIFLSVQQSFADEITIKNMLFAVLRLCVAIPIVLGLSLPLVLADLCDTPILATELAILPGALLTKYLFPFVTALPLYLYDAGLWLTGNVPTAGSNVVKDKVASDMLWAAGFFAGAKKVVESVVPDSVRKHFEHEYFGYASLQLTNG